MGTGAKLSHVCHLASRTCTLTIRVLLGTIFHYFCQCKIHVLLRFGSPSVSVAYTIVPKLTPQSKKQKVCRFICTVSFTVGFGQRSLALLVKGMLTRFNFAVFQRQHGYFHSRCVQCYFHAFTLLAKHCQTTALQYSSLLWCCPGRITHHEIQGQSTSGFSNTHHSITKNKYIISQLQSIYRFCFLSKHVF